MRFGMELKRIKQVTQYILVQWHRLVSVQDLILCMPVECPKKSVQYHNISHYVNQTARMVSVKFEYVVAQVSCMVHVKKHMFGMSVTRETARTPPRSLG